MKIGVLAVQGAFAEHISLFKQLGVEAVPVRLPRELQFVDGIVIPGGESTTISQLLQNYNLMQPLRDYAAMGMPFFGTCAGMILMAKHVSGNNFLTLSLMDIQVRRNAYGRQIDSFETDIILPEIGATPFRAVFIRAPLIEQCYQGVEVLAKLPDDTVVAAKQNNCLVTAFHPELTEDPRIHRLFLDMIYKTG